MSSFYHLINRKCSQRQNFQKGLDVCAPAEFNDCVELAGVSTIVDLAYCESQDERCFLNECQVCGGDNAFEFFRSRIGILSLDALRTPIGFQVWEKDAQDVWMSKSHVEPLSDVLRRVVDWIKGEKMGLHERQVALQSQFCRDIKSWDYELNRPHSSLSQDAVCLKWDHAMRPLMSNNQELASNHWLTHGIPLMGFIAIYRESREEMEFQGELVKRHIFVTAPTTAKDHWHFTALALKEVLNHLWPLIGQRKQMIFISDGSTKQVYF